MGDEIKVRFTVDGDQGLKKLEDVARAEQRVGDVTDQVSRDAASHASRFGDLQSQIEGLTKSFLGLAAVKAVVIDTLTEITKKAVEANGEIAKLSKETGGLAANIGGKLSGEAFKEIGGVSADAMFSPEDNKKLVEFVAGMSDMREIGSVEDVRDIARKGAALQKATGGGMAGQQGADLMQKAVARLGVNDDQAVNILSSLGNSGFSAGQVDTLISKGADTDLLALMHASKGSGLNKEDLGRKMDSLVSSLMATDDKGATDPALAALGVTKDMNATARLTHLVKGNAGGSITDEQLFKATGGYQSQSLVTSLAPSILGDKVGAAREELMDANAAKKAIANRLASPFAQAEQIENLRKLDEYMEKVQFGQTNFAQGAADFKDGTGNFLGIPSIMQTVRGLATTDEDVQSMPAKHIENIKGRLGLTQRDLSKVPMPWYSRVAAGSSPPTPAASPIPAAGYAGFPFLAADDGSGSGLSNVPMIMQQNNYHGCSVGVPDPGKEPSRAKELR